MASYSREAAVRYAKKWALSRNSVYLDFEKLGGDCTNFVSQCLYAGIPEMNYGNSAGWYYLNAYSRSPSWAGVHFLYDFLVGNRSSGPRAYAVDASGIQPGDVVQLGDSVKGFHHSLLVISVQADDLFVAAHSYDVWMQPLSSYAAEQSRFLHIFGSSDV
jgi:hypothetical protein